MSSSFCPTQSLCWLGPRVCVGNPGAHVKALSCGLIEPQCQEMKAERDSGAGTHLLLSCHQWPLISQRKLITVTNINERGPDARLACRLAWCMCVYLLACECALLGYVCFCSCVRGLAHVCACVFELIPYQDQYVKHRSSGEIG